MLAEGDSELWQKLRLAYSHPSSYVREAALLLRAANSFEVNYSPVKSQLEKGALSSPCSTQHIKANIQAAARTRLAE